MPKTGSFPVTDIELCDDRLTFYEAKQGHFACHGQVRHNDMGTGGQFQGTIATPAHLHNRRIEVTFDGPDGTCTVRD